MTKQDFIQYLSEPEKLNGHSVEKLEKLVSEYPYFQTAHLLYLKNLHNLGSILYEKHLGIASAHAPDRKMLFRLIRRKKTTEVFPQPQQEITVAARHHSPAEKRTDTLLPVLEPVIVLEEMPLLLPEERKATKEKEYPGPPETPGEKTTAGAEIRDKKLSFSQWMKFFPMERKGTGLPGKRKISMEQTQKIIDRFILEQVAKSSPKPKVEFYSADSMAKKSLQDDETFVTETLAGIYLRQGNLKKALRAYKILLVKHPEKFHIFAPLLEKIKQQIQTDENRSIQK